MKFIWLMQGSTKGVRGLDQTTVNTDRPKELSCATGQLSGLNARPGRKVPGSSTQQTTEIHARPAQKAPGSSSRPATGINARPAKRGQGALPDKLLGLMQGPPKGSRELYPTNYWDWWKARSKAPGSSTRQTAGINARPAQKVPGSSTRQTAGINARPPKWASATWGLNARPSPSSYDWTLWLEWREGCIVYKYHNVLRTGHVFLHCPRYCK